MSNIVSAITMLFTVIHDQYICHVLSPFLLATFSSEVLMTLTLFVVIQDSVYILLINDFV